MIILQKTLDKDFIVLNLTDIQLNNDEWAEGHVNREIVEYTVKELVKRTNPDLITVSGDLAWAGCDGAYAMLAEFLEQFQIPWAPIWGNHDNQNGAKYIDKIATLYQSQPHCLYEKGALSLGNGNYVICIEEDGKIVESIFMMDSHDKVTYVDEQGEEKLAWAKLTAEQIEWYKEQTDIVKGKGCTDSTLIVHIPIFAYRTASRAAYKGSISLNEVTLAQAEGADCWTEGYLDSVGVQHEDVSSYPYDDGVFAAIKEKGITKHVIAGHDHVNNWIIRYDGVKMIFALKTGPGCYWDSCMNGGTVLKINQNGVYNVSHEYVDISHILSK